jgi:hypothetical protein
MTTLPGKAARMAAVLGVFAATAPVAFSEPCAVRVTAASLEVVSSRCPEDDGLAEPMLGYAHAGETYVAIARSGKWLKVAFNGKEGWLPAWGLAEIQGAPALRFPSTRSVRAAAAAGSTEYGQVGENQIYAVLEDDGAVSRIVWGGGAVWVDSADAARLTVIGMLESNNPTLKPIEWDPCLDRHHVTYVGGGGLWRLTKAEARLDVNDEAYNGSCRTGPFCSTKTAGDPQSGGNINIYITCLDGGVIACHPDVTPIATYPGQTVTLTSCKSGEQVNPYTTDFPMFGGFYDPCQTGADGPFDIYIDPATNGGQTSDRINGMGLPWNHHHTFHLTFEKNAVIDGPPAVTPDPPASSSPPPGGGTPPPGGGTPPPSGSAPDLVITAMTFNPAPAYSGDAIVANVTVQNSGSAATSGPFRVGVTVNGTLVGTGMSSGTLAAGASTTITTSPVVGQAGSYSVTASADDQNGVTETNEGNNSYSTNLSVLSGTNPSPPPTSTPPPGSSSPPPGGGTTPPPTQLPPPQYTDPGNNPRADYVSGGDGGSHSSEGIKGGSCWAGAAGGANGLAFPLLAAALALAARRRR